MYCHLFYGSQCTIYMHAYSTSAHNFSLVAHKQTSDGFGDFHAGK